MPIETLPKFYCGSTETDIPPGNDEDERDIDALTFDFSTYQSVGL